ncbi:MAG: hypothetical protein GWP74_16905 [Proteobacteria bacterium]|nr:hypothetical protein [Pseudomonadota bacterium]
MLVQQGQIVDLMLIGIGSTVEMQEIGGGGYVLYHTTVAAQENLRVVGPVDIRVTAVSFSTSVGGAERALPFSGGGVSVAAEIYLFRASFDRANQIFANADTVGAGGTYEDGVEDGLGTVYDLGTEVVEVDANELKITGATAWGHGLSTQSIPRLAGQVARTFMELNTAGDTYLFMMPTTNPAAGNWLARAGFTPTQKRVMDYQPAGTYKFGLTYAADIAGSVTGAAYVLGGWGDAEPEIAGTAGMSPFIFDGTDWERQLSLTSNNDANVHFAVSRYATGYTKFNDFHVPETLAPDVLYPVGDVADSIVDLFNGAAVAVNSRSPDVGDWNASTQGTLNGSGAVSVPAGTTVTFYPNDRALYKDSGGFIARCRVYVPHSGADKTTFWYYTRYVSGSSYWRCVYYTNTDRAKIIESGVDRTDNIASKRGVVMNVEVWDNCADEIHFILDRDQFQTYAATTATSGAMQFTLQSIAAAVPVIYSAMVVPLKDAAYHAALGAP